MKSNTKKLRIIYLPILLNIIAFIVIYTFLNWLLLIKTNTFSIKEDIVNFHIPFFLPWIPVLIYIRPKIKLLNLTGANGNLPFLYQFIVAMSMAIPTIIAKGYIERASGELTKLQTINQIDKLEQTKYYTLNKFYIDKKNVGVHRTFDVSGKYNQYFNMHLYIVLPILVNKSDTINSSCLAWLGVEYWEQISNKIENKNKENFYQIFLNETNQDFEKKDFSKFIYLERIGNTDKGYGFKEAVKKSGKSYKQNPLILIAVSEPFENRIGNSFIWIFGSFGIGSCLLLIMILIPKLDENKLNQYVSVNSSNKDVFNEIIDHLKPKEGYFITPIIIYLNIFIFFVMVTEGLGFILFKGDDLLNWGANFRPLTTNAEWWRLLSSTFLHGGIMHILTNMYALLYVGIFLEPVLGRTKFVAAYLLSGIIASCTSIWWYDSVVSVGASGAIFGLYGIFLALLLTKIFPPDFSKELLTSTIFFIGFNLIMGLAGGIDNAAHIGGLLSGFIIGFIFYPKLKKQH